MRDITMLVVWVLSVVSMGLGAICIITRGGRGLYAVEKLALGFGVGIGIMTVEMAVLSAVGLKINLAYLVVPSVLSGVCALYFRKEAAGVVVVRENTSRIEKFFIAAIAFEVLYALFKAVVMPIEAYDAIAISGLKAKIFYLSSGVPKDFFTDMASFVPHAEYPLLIPLAETSVYTFLGSLNDIASKVIFPLYYLATLAVLYYAVMRISGRRAALLFTFLLATVPQVRDYASNGYSDLPLAFYFLASVALIVLWSRQRLSGYLALSFILSIFAAWTKVEGLMLFGINIFIVLLFISTSGKGLIKQGLVYAAASILSILAYLCLMRYLGLNPNSDFNITGIDLFSGIKRIPAILYEYQIQFFGPKKWNIIWVLVIAAFVMNMKSAFSGTVRLVTAAVLLTLAGYTAIYMITPQDLGLHLSTTASRLFIHFSPVAILWLAMICKEKDIKL